MKSCWWWGPLLQLPRPPLPLATSNLGSGLGSGQKIAVAISNSFYVAFFPNSGLHTKFHPNWTKNITLKRFSIAFRPSRNWHMPCIRPCLYAKSDIENFQLLRKYLTHIRASMTSLLKITLHYITLHCSTRWGIDVIWQIITLLYSEVLTSFGILYPHCVRRNNIKMPIS